MINSQKSEKKLITKNYNIIRYKISSNIKKSDTTTVYTCKCEKQSYFKLDYILCNKYSKSCIPGGLKPIHHRDFQVSH